MNAPSILRNPRLSIGLQILFWITIYIFLWQSNGGPYTGNGNMWPPIPFLAGTASLVYLNIFVLIPRVLIKRNVWLYLLAVLVSIALLQGVLNLVTTYNPREVTVIIAEIDAAGNRTTTIRHPQEARIGMSIIASFIFLFFSTIFGLGREFVRRERERSRLENERLASEMKFLRAQINPHFLFNAMNNLYATVKLQPAKAGEIISRISDMLRYVIYDCGKPKVRLDKEIEYLKNYVYFQELKDPDRVRVNLAVDVEDGGFALEPMLLLPFVENAFKHSYSDTAESIEVEISLQADRQSLTFRCANSMPPDRQTLSTDPSHSGIGIRNVQSRLDFAYPAKHDLTIAQNGARYCATLTLQS
ncbi:MAG: histidine kinase [Bacteroidota bacterium]